MENSNKCDCKCDECVEKTKFFFIPNLREINVCLNNITELSLSSSSISEVPEFIASLECIVKLDLSSNELFTLPVSFTELQRLTHLNLSRNKFTVIPKCLIDGMRCVTSLNLSHNQMSNIKKPFCIQRIVTLNVSNNLELDTLPRWLWSIECNSIESLDISFTRCLENIEVDPYLNMYGIGKCLKNLNVANTNANVFKLDFVRHLKNLRTVILDNKSTTKSNTHENYFNSVPLVFNYRFKFIVSLSISNVNLSNIGKNMYFILPNLWFLNLSNNCIVLLPDSFSKLTNLEVCDLSNNQILEFPKCFKNLINLKKLILNNNWLSTFPEILGDLLNLQLLDLYANKLVVCPLWNTNSNIKSIDLEQNVFSTENDIDQDIKANYSNMLKNLRSSINESRTMGPICVEDYNDLEYLNENVRSSNWSLYSSSEYIPCEESLIDTNFKPEELWESNSYEYTIIFDPKAFELSLIREMNRLKSPLRLYQRTKENNIVRKAIHLSNEHYFCPNDELLGKL